MAALSTKGRVQVQATLAAVKEMSGWTFYGCIACAVLMLVIPWRKGSWIYRHKILYTRSFICFIHHGGAYFIS